MSDFEEVAHLRIPLDHIITATNKFSHHNFLGQGGFGRVYKGQLPPSRPSADGPGTTVAVKRLDEKLAGQGSHEFLNEIVLLARYKHHNLVSLIGFVDEGREKILVYKYEDNGSLDNYLGSTNLKWEQRLRICIGAAKGLDYLHSGLGTVHRVIHRDVKSSNVLLDADWEAKISDFGLSKIGPKNMPHTFLVTAACGTHGYVDPQYAITGVLTKESDVYSFGVVLFEVLCGRLGINDIYEDERRLLSRLVKKYYRGGKLNEIILPCLVEQMNPDSLDFFTKIAFRCLNEEPKRRPAMRSVVQELENALEHQLGKRISEPEHQTGTRTRLWGSQNGGSPFLFQLQSNQKLRRITIIHDVWILSLCFTIVDSNGSFEYKVYGVRPSYMSFRESTARTFEIDIDEDEEIIGLSGSVGKYRNNIELVTTLCVTTTKGKYGPFTYEADDRFSGSWDAGLFDGFYGRSGEYIDAIGCCLKDTKRNYRSGLK